MRIGFGYDAHPLVPGRPLILGGVRVPYQRGLSGYSDADVIVHALCDAMLGALALGDLGQHFPSTDERWHGVSSLMLLQHVNHLVRERQYALGNADMTIVAQRPRLASYLTQMVQTLAATIEVEPSQISIKATTTDGLGFSGQGAGIAAYAVCLVVPCHHSAPS
ncbi:2-C-methyl-D-erythritol 2,4-cyclodiphosphate synthase [Candidatus Entotheonellaceae bacterium PAL068K]